MLSIVACNGERGSIRLLCIRNHYLLSHKTKVHEFTGQRSLDKVSAKVTAQHTNSNASYVSVN